MSVWGHLAIVVPEPTWRMAYVWEILRKSKIRILVQSDIHHFSYLGDATVGEHVNIAAGSITSILMVSRNNVHDWCWRFYRV